jgi:hypothetical protein
MSRKFRFHVGPRSPKDEERLLRAVMRQAQPDDDVQLKCTPSAAEAESTPRRANEQLETRIGERLATSLDKANATADAEPDCDNEQPEHAADRIAEATKGVKSWRQTLNEAGWKVVVETVLKSAWESRWAIWTSVTSTIRDFIP